MSNRNEDLNPVDPLVVNSKETAARPEQVVPKLLITIKEAAELTGVCERTIWARTKAGEIACRYIGRAVRYVPEELVAWRDGLPRQKP